MGQHDIVLSEIDGSAPAALQAVKLLASYSSQKDNRAVAVSTIREWLIDVNTSSNATVQLIAGIVFTHEENYPDALRALRSAVNLEMMAQTVQVLLRMNRTQLAEEQLQQMQRVDADATLTQLATGWVYLALGGAKANEALYIFQQLIDMFGDSVMLQNSLAVAHMKMQDFSQAKAILVSAVNNSVNADTLVNLIVCCYHLGESNDLVKRYITQLRGVDPDHPWLKSIDGMGESFDRVAATIA